MSCRQVAIVGVIATTLAGAPRTAAADPIIIDLTIASGVFHVGEFGGSGLRVSGQDFSLLLVGGAFVDCLPVNGGCPVGAVTNSLSFSGQMGASEGLVTYRDRTFDLSQTGGGTFTFDSPSFAFTPGVLTYKMPFGLTGLISILSGEGETFEQFEFHVHGGGTATGAYDLFPPEQETFVGLRDLSVNFGSPPPAVVPEPSSLLLLGTGVAGLIVRTARRRRQ